MMAARALGPGLSKGRTSFLKKRSKKLLDVWAEPIRRRTPYDQKFFGSFFQKRTSFLLSTP
jgi:hypothetical protein